MIDEGVVREHAAAHGVPRLQIERDHLLSHLIHALPTAGRLVFIGGTALNRTFLPDVRLSEDLDLHLLEGDGNTVVDELRARVRLEFPELDIVRGETFHGATTFHLTSGSLRLRVQTIKDRWEWERLESDPYPVRLRYPDLSPNVHVRVPTIAGFGAMKLAAFVDRRAARDLFDLWQMTSCGLLGAPALDGVSALLGRRLAREEFGAGPGEDEWRTELAHQVRDAGSPGEALRSVVAVLARLYGW